jgi:mRNA interferase RelE/StbE
MMRVVLTREAQKQIDDLPGVIQARIYGVLVRLQDWPEVSGAKPLKGALAGYYRIRTGDYRIQFRVEEAQILIVVVKVGHRDGFYE